jgi:hypothetical protein
VKEFYKKISIHDLILFGVSSVNSKKEKCTYERLVKECFDLFPKSFSFSEIPNWPDARKLDRSLRSLRKKKMLTGDPKNVFALTKIGRKSAEDISKIFRQGRLGL